jgi:hypothetical protein
VHEALIEQLDQLVVGQARALEDDGRAAVVQ